MTKTRRLSHPLVIGAAGAVVLALVSLAFPSAPTYDPYTWLIWGRDLAHFNLVTSGNGTAWKPLPPLIDALLTPLGSATPEAWLVVARAGGLFAIFLAARIAWRLTPRPYGFAAAPVAAASLLLTQRFIREAGFGASEGLMTAAGLLAIDSHLSGHRRRAFALIVLGSLIRVEMWPFALGYGGWLWWRSRGTRARAGVAVGLLLIPLLWFGADWLGSGHLTTGADRALERKPGTPGASAHPAKSVLIEVHQMLTLPAWIGIAIAVATAGAALVLSRRARRPLPREDAVILWFAGIIVAWIAIVIAMTERGYAGLPRFLFMASALEAILAGVGIARAAALVPRRAAALGVAAVLAAFAVLAFPSIRALSDETAAVKHVAQMDSELVDAVSDAGGATAILRCGRPTTTWYSVPVLAYYLHVHTERVEVGRFGHDRVTFRPIHNAWEVRRQCAPRT